MPRNSRREEEMLRVLRAVEAGLDPGTFTFTRTGGNPATSLQIGFTRGGTAAFGSDYTGVSTTVNILANHASATVTATPVDDAIVEGPETVIVTINSSANYNIGAQNTATVTIADND